MRKLSFFLFLIFFKQVFSGNNQTETVNEPLPPDSLPFKISIELADFQLPSDPQNAVGLQSFVYGFYNNKWLLLAGRTNGMHGFGPGDNFPPRQQNTTVYVVDFTAKTVVSKSLYDSSSGLSQTEIDTLSVTAPQYAQSGTTLYVVGGYGIDTLSGEFGTKPILTAIDIPGLIGWVEGEGRSAISCIRQTSHPLVQVTGGFLTRTAPHSPFLLVFGQNFIGTYSGTSNGIYTEQVRPFKIIDNGVDLYVKPEKQLLPNSSYRRRDLAVFPIMRQSGNTYLPAVAALSGVFTLDTGIWTVPVVINPDGSSTMADPLDPTTFKQGMNNYDCARTGLFSKKTNEMYMLLFGGITYLRETGGVFIPDVELPFINSVTTVKIDPKGNFTQYLMDSSYPEILSDFSHPGNQLLFGAEARFIPARDIPTFSNAVFSLDELGSSPTLLGYIVGGIQSTLPHTNSLSDSAASPYIFTVTIQRQ